MPIDRFRLKLSIIAGLFALTACSGSQPTQNRTTTAVPAGQPAPAATSAENSDAQKLSAERVMQLQREGYKLVNRDGQTYYCRTEAKTGSHLARDTVCMTETEIATLREQTKQGLGRVMREQPPPQGK